MILAVNKTHPLADKEALTIEDLKEVPFILHESGSVSRKLTMEWAAANQLPLHEALEVSATETMKEAVRQNIGIAIISELNVKREIEEGNMVGFPLPGLNFNRMIYLIYHKHRLLTPPMEHFLQHSILEMMTV